MKHLAMACYYFPPDGGGGTQRPLSIARYAAQSGWRVTVMTRSVADRGGMWDPKDDTLRLDSEQVRVIRVPTPPGTEAGQMVAPDQATGDPWVTELVDRIERLHRQDPLTALLLTMPPYGMCGLAVVLKSRLPKLPLVVDLRDPWALDGAVSYASISQWRRNRRWMLRTFEACDGIVANTPEAGSSFAEFLPGFESLRMAVVPNGYDASDFQNPLPPKPAGYLEGRLHLVHTGTMHSQAVLKHQGLVGRLRRLRAYRAESINVMGRTPKPLLDAIARLRREHAPGIETLALILVGVDDRATAKLIADSGVADLVTLTGYLPHDQSIAWLRWAECLFLPLHGLPEGQRSRIVPGKTYEYLASGKPILAALPEGDARDLIEATNRGFCADPCDPAQIAVALRRILDLHQQGALQQEPPLPWVRDYHRGELTKRMFAFIDRIVEFGPRSRLTVASFR